MSRLRITSAWEQETKVLVVLLVATLVAVRFIVGPGFFSGANLESMAFQVSEFGFLALAMGIVILSGGLDLSIVSAAGLAGIAAATVLSGEVVPVTEGNGIVLVAVAVVVATLTALLCGLTNALLVAKLSVPPILATLATMILFSGIGMALTAGASVPVRVGDYAVISAATFAGVPVVFIALLVTYAVTASVLARTRIGRYLYLFGENHIALKFSGIKTERVVMTAYLLSGLLVGIAAIVIVSRVNSARVGFGESYLLQTILVVVLAGFNPYGGKGKVWNIFLGLVILQMLQSSFTALHFSPFAKSFSLGSTLILVMVVNHLVRTGALGRVLRRRRAPGGPPVTDGTLSGDKTEVLV